MNIASLAVGALSWKIKLVAAAIALALLASVYAWRVHVERDYGRAEVQLKWDAAVSQQREVDLQAAYDNARETLRRLNRQQENQHAQDQELAAARAAADRNARDRDRMRQQASTAADQWSHTLRNSPTSAELEAAAAAIRVCTDVLGRADRRASLLAGHSDTARAHGLKCERDYDALTPVTPTTERKSP